MSRLFYFGRARLVETETDGVLVIYDGPCPTGGPETDPKTLFLKVVAANGCALNIVEGRPLLLEAGVHMQEVRAMLLLLENDGALSLLADGEIAILTDEVCNDFGPTPELVTDLAHDPIANPRNALIEFLELTGCELAYEDAQIVLSTAGFDLENIDKLGPDYIVEGIIEVGPNETLIMTIGRCG